MKNEAMDRWYAVCCKPRQEAVAEEGEARVVCAREARCVDAREGLTREG